MKSVSYKKSFARCAPIAKDGETFVSEFTDKVFEEYIGEWEKLLVKYFMIGA